MFCRKNKKYYFAKKWGCHGTPGIPGVDGPVRGFKTTQEFRVSFIFSINSKDFCKNGIFDTKLIVKT